MIRDADPQVDTSRYRDVLDHGYVWLTDWMGNDLTVVNAARASFSKASKHFVDKDAKLIQYLARHQHTSPFRHAVITFEVKAPLMVARQWWKYVVGSVHDDGDGAEGFDTAWNETSRRYVTMEPEFYIPDEWRSAPEDKKQGSGGPVASGNQAYYSVYLGKHIDSSMALYEQALRDGVCAEQARLFLPAYAMYTTWRWTVSLQAVCHFIYQRASKDAQKEIRRYAWAVKEIIEPLYPVSVRALLGRDFCE